MPVIAAGDVIHVMANFVTPRKTKYLLCVCPQRIKYFVINTAPYILAMDAQFALKKAAAPWLDYDSWIDTSKLLTLTAMETQYVVDADPRCHRGVLPAEVRQAIKAFVGGHRIMPKDQMSIVGQSL